MTVAGASLTSIAGCLNDNSDEDESGGGTQYDDTEMGTDESSADDNGGRNESDQEANDRDIERQIRFEKYDSLNTFTVSDYIDNVSIVPTPDFEEQGNSCKIVFPEGVHDAANLEYQFGPEHGYEPEAMYAKYWLYLDESFKPSTNGKLPGFAGTYGEAGSAGQRSDGTNGWSARGSFYPPNGDGTIPIGNYVYHVDMDSSGTHALWETSLKRGRWYRIDQYLQLNTPGEYDGILRGWVDQSLVYDRDNWRWRDTDELKIEEWWGHFYHGGNNPAPRKLRLYIDDLSLDTTALL